MPVYWASSAGVITSAGAGLITNLAVCKLALAWLGADPDKLSDVDTITTSSTKEEQLCNIVFDTARKAVLEAKNWQFATRESQLNLAAGTAEADFNTDGNIKAITGITAADPCVVTAANHGFLNGWLVRIYDVSGMTEINGMVVRVANKDINTFECYQLDGSNFTAYTSGGYCVRYEANPAYQNGYVYEVPTDMLRPVATLPEGARFEIVGSGDSRRLLSDTQDLVLQYIADVSTVSEMPDHFARAWAARIAAELAAPLQKKGTGMKDMWEHYMQVLNENTLSNARNVDAKSMIRQTSPTLSDGGWE
jgi:hypothetical protein